MVCNDNKNQIETIIGDTLSRVFTVTDKFVEHPEDFIDKVYFVCNELKIIKELDPIGENNWKLKIDSTITSTFKPMMTTYDIKVYFKDGTHDTGIREASLTILDTENKM